MIQRYGAMHPGEQVADVLNAASLTTGKGKPFAARHVAIVRANHKIFAPRTVGTTRT